MWDILSTPEQLKEIEECIKCYLTTPFSSMAKLGNELEDIIAYVRGGVVNSAFSFADVIIDRVGWQIKTSSSYVIIWKRISFPNQTDLIEKSKINPQELGNMLLNNCNEHVEKCAIKYNLDLFVYSRLITSKNGMFSYFERPVDKILFSPEMFYWKWGERNDYPTFAGYHVVTGEKWFSWSGMKDNQFRFMGEHNWHLTDNHPNKHTFHVDMKNKMSFGEYKTLLLNRG